MTILHLNCSQKLHLNFEMGEIFGEFGVVASQRNAKIGF